jgi:hypothetical protein
MRNSLNFSVLAAFSLVGAAAYAQAPTAPNTPTTSVTRPAANPELTGASTAARGAPGLSHGMPVKSESGEVLGTVSSIVPGDGGKGDYVVIADHQGIATPLPVSTARNMVQKNALVVDATRFQKAPKVQESQSEDDTKAHWQDRADNYWKRSASAGVLR